MPLKELRDIKTHSTLARQGRLVSVARNWHRLKGYGNEIRSAADLSEWNIERHIFKKSKSVKRVLLNVSPFLRDLHLEGRKIRLYQIEATQSFLEEFRHAFAEGIPVAIHEFERLKTRLAELQTE